MKTRTGPSLIFASDKVIFDALNHSQVPIDLIRQLLFDRGILVSHKTDKLGVASHFSRLTADYLDNQSIGNKLGRVTKKERVTYTEIKEPLSTDQIKQGAASVIKKLEDKGNVVTLSVDGSSVYIFVQYDHIDYTESEFRQVQPRDALIEFIPDPHGHYIVRNTHNNFIDTATESIFAGIESIIGKALPLTHIGLEGFADPKVRTRFFEDLVEDIEGHKLDGLTDAYCYRPRTTQVGGLDSDERQADTDKQPYVVRVTLKGNDVNKTFMADDLYKAGYYLVKVVWRVKAKNKDSELIEIEAQFGDPASCTGFSYQARCAIICEDGIATDQKRVLHKNEQDNFLRLIEAAARRAMAKAEA